MTSASRICSTARACRRGVEVVAPYAELGASLTRLQAELDDAS
ncbi:hypothetical protein [Deinococcus yavapaiensis]|nr:hypothetical protein [Deinococcus yavapaiensis]